MITPKITNLGYSNLWTDMSTILGYASNFNQQIQKLFSNGEQGFAYDPNDLSTMFQDVAGTVPVTTVGQSVGMICDKSGRNNHAYQTTSASRPILRKNAITGANYLEFDGSDDFLQTSNIDFTATDKVSLFAGLRKRSDATGVFVELSTSADTNPNSFYLLTPQGSRYPFSFYTKAGMTMASTVAVPLGVAFAPFSCVTIVKSAMVINGDVSIKINQNTYTTKNTTAIGKYGNYPLYIGRRAGYLYPFNGHLYSLIGIGRLTTDSETTALEKAIAKNTGVTLSV